MRAQLFVLVPALLAAFASAGETPFYKTEDCNKYVAQMDLNSCTGGNSQAADDALNKLYKQVMARQPDQAAKDRLHDSERLWIKQRDKFCADDVGEQADGGSIWPMEMNTCLQNQTDVRIKILRSMK